MKAAKPKRFRQATSPGGGVNTAPPDQAGTSTPLLNEDEPAESALWAVLSTRVERAIRQSLRDGPWSVSELARILEEPSDVGATAALLAHGARASSVVQVDALAAAKARAVHAEQSLMAAAGGTLRIEDVAKLLGVSRQAIEKRRVRLTLLGVRANGGTYLYPACQFATGDVLPGLDRFLQAFPKGTDPWMMLNVLVGRSGALDDRRPLDVLQAGDIDAAVEVAESAFDAGE